LNNSTNIYGSTPLRLKSKNDKEQNDKAFEAKEKNNKWVTLKFVHDYNINGNTTFTLHNLRIKKDSDPIISPSIK
jgi:hypothetical protein